MEFKIIHRDNENIHKYPTEDYNIAGKFATELHKELDRFMVSVILFGSSARREPTAHSDIDVLIISDDTTFTINEALTETYKIMVDNLIAKHSPKLHITSMTLTSFWEYVKNGDPVIVNILRDGVPLIDYGLFEPLHVLLKQGRIRPSEESVWRYFGRSPRTLLSSRWHLLQATMDLYWAVIDSAHAALMRKNEIPPTPEHVADLLELVFVKHRLLEAKYVDTMRKFYRLSKMITHRELKDMKGADYEKLYLEADAFVKRMKILIEKGMY